MPSFFIGKIEIFYDFQPLVKIVKKIYNFALSVGLASAEQEKKKKRKRKNFSKSTQKLTLIAQRNVCKSCKKPSKHWDYHHKNGDRSNNLLGNCEALCLVCHAEKTRKAKF